MPMAYGCHSSPACTGFSPLGFSPLVALAVDSGPLPTSLGPLPLAQLLSLLLFSPVPQYLRGQALGFGPLPSLGLEVQALVILGLACPPSLSWSRYDMSLVCISWLLARVFLVRLLVLGLSCSQGSGSGSPCFNLSLSFHLWAQNLVRLLGTPPWPPIHSFQPHQSSSLKLERKCKQPLLISCPSRSLYSC